MPTTIELVPLAGALGAEVRGIDPATADATDVDALRAALLEHLVLVFRDVDITPEQQIAFAGLFGEIHRPPVRTKFSQYPEMNVLDQESGKGDADQWHQDNTYAAEPPSVSVLHVVKAPRAGGDTSFASMPAAYEALSPAMRGLVDGLSAEHDITRSLSRAISRGQTNIDLAAAQAQFPPVVHPVVVTHPRSGRRCLFVNPQSTSRIVDMSPEEGQMLLSFLYEHVKTPAFQVRVRWDERTVVLVDNIGAQHCAVADFSERRILHRVAVKGGRPS